MNSNNKDLVEYLSKFVSENRLIKFQDAIKFRTRYLTIILEDIYQPHNASAVLRSCDCFGIQDVHIIENKNPYTINPDVALGSTKWLNLKKHNKEENNTLSCIENLKSEGYKIIATTPHEKDCNIEDLEIEGKIALLFGTELHGISDVARQHADGFVKIPMFGFTESFNISVSAAICLHQLTNKLHKSNINWQINEREKDELMLTWLRNTINRPELIEKDFHEKNQSSINDPKFPL